MSSAITGSVNVYEADRVYGRDVKTWSVDGAGGKTFADVIAFASVRQAAAVETMTNAVGAMAELRQKKVSDLGEALAIVAEALGSMDPKEKDPDKKVSQITASKLTEANAILEKYEIPKMTLTKDGQVTYANAAKMQTKIQNALDTEQNDLNLMMTQLEGLVEKRDNSFNVAAKVVEKSNATELQTIRALGT